MGSNVRPLEGQNTNASEHDETARPCEMRDAAVAPPSFQTHVREFTGQELGRVTELKAEQDVKAAGDADLVEDGVGVGVWDTEPDGACEGVTTRHFCLHSAELDAT